MSRNKYSIYEAKAKFSEIIRIVKQRRRVIITERGTSVAEVVPYRTNREEGLDERIEGLTQIGVIVPPAGRFRAKPVRLISGASDRFLAQDRD